MSERNEARRKIRKLEGLVRLDLPTIGHGAKRKGERRERSGNGPNLFSSRAMFQCTGSSRSDAVPPHFLFSLARAAFPPLPPDEIFPQMKSYGPLGPPPSRFDFDSPKGPDRAQSDLVKSLEEFVGNPSVVRKTMNLGGSEGGRQADSWRAGAEYPKEVSERFVPGSGTWNKERWRKGEATKALSDEGLPTTERERVCVRERRVVVV